MKGLLLAVLLASPPAGAEEPVTPEATEVAESPPPGAPRFRAAVEALFHSFPSGTPAGAQDLFLTLTPLLGFDGGEDFGLELGAGLRFRVFDDPPEQRGEDYGRVLRGADWDQASDFGQLLRELRIGREDSVFWVRAGPAERHTLGHGHLVSRYSNRLNPDYHPASATAQMVLGPTRTEAFASDVLGARLFAADLSLDLGRVLGDDPGAFDRYHLAFSFAHDSANGGASAPPLTLLHLDFDLALHRGEGAQVFTFAGVGSRVFVPVSDLGLSIGLSAEGRPGGVQLGGKAELRKQSGGFRHGMFGPDYELARFAATGFSGEPIALEQLPDSYSGYGELQLATGPREEPDEAFRAVLSLAGEHFAWGRTDADLSLALRALGGKGTGTVRFTGVGMNVRPRYVFSAEARYRLLPALYTLASGGTVFFPQPDGTLVRGVFAGLGIGADFER